MLTEMEMIIFVEITNVYLAPNQNSYKDLKLLNDNYK